MFFKRKGKEEPAEASPTRGPAQELAGDHAAVLRDELGLYHLWYLELRLREELARAARVESLF